MIVQELWDDTILGEIFMHLRWDAVQDMLDDIAVTNKGWVY